jgi:2-dehydropantoate 2-reductase
LITIVGAGSVGLSLGARLARAGAPMAFLTRRAEAAAALESRGVEVSDPSDGSAFTQGARAFHRVEDLPDDHKSGVVVLCVRATETDALAGPLAAALPQALFVCAQNDVDNEARLSAHASHVAGLVYRQTCTRLDDRSVRALGRGRLVVGDHPSGCSARLGAFAAAAERAGFDVGRSERIGCDKWLKLCVNLMSTPNALVRREDHTTHAFVEVKARLVEEAKRVLEAAGIEASSCDGRDRSLEQEIAHQRASLGAGTSARREPVYNAVWRALESPGLGLEANRYHARIIALAEANDVPVPTNRAALAALERAVREGHGAESVTAASLLP